LDRQAHNGIHINGPINDILEWYDVLKQDGIDKQAYQQLKEGFLLAYTPAQTARTELIHIQNLKQGPNESEVNI
jgi:hypothetical protein